MASLVILSRFSYVAHLKGGTYDKLRETLKKIHPQNNLEKMQN